MKRFFLWTSLVTLLLPSLTFATFDKRFTLELLELDRFLLTGEHDHVEGRSFAITEENASRWVSSSSSTSGSTPTPSQPEGPFYPIRLPAEVDMDLTVVGDGEPAKGTIVYVQGQVLNEQGQIIEGSVVEIWQACASGKYNHRNDPNPAEIDPNFQYYAKATTKADGYMFKTIVPGAYPATGTWWRPEHIHMKVKAPGYKSLTTQFYFNPASFPGTPIGMYNEADLILSRLSVEERRALTVTFSDKAELSAKLGVFSVVLKRR